MLAWRKGNIEKNCIHVTVLCTIIMVLKGTSSSIRSVDRTGIGLWPLLSVFQEPLCLQSSWCCITLRSSALTLCYSAAEYCAPVWSRAAHTSQVDVQLNSTMRLVSGTLRSTPLPWLPVLSNIEPPALWRKAATDKLVEKIVKRDSWPIQPDILNPPLLRLISRKPLWLDLQPVDIKSRCRHIA